MDHEQYNLIYYQMFILLYNDFLHVSNLILFDLEYLFYLLFKIRNIIYFGLIIYILLLEIILILKMIINIFCYFLVIIFYV